MLPYHRVREAIAANILDFYWCASDQNESDKHRKDWKHAKVKDTIVELFDYHGEHPF